MDKKKPQPAKSQRLFGAGFKTLSDARECLQAVAADLAADRISATEANQFTSAAGKWLRTCGSRLREEPKRKASR